MHQLLVYGSFILHSPTMNYSPTSVAPQIATYSIKFAAQQAGITPECLRVWEKRYGWPVPLRRPNGYRGFTENQIAQLISVSDLLLAGMTITEALRKLGHIK